jgi:hypothetical protein
MTEGNMIQTTRLARSIWMVTKSSLKFPLYLYQHFFFQQIRTIFVAAVVAAVAEHRNMATLFCIREADLVMAAHVQRGGHT